MSATESKSPGGDGRTIPGDEVIFWDEGEVRFAGPDGDSARARDRRPERERKKRRR